MSVMRHLSTVSILFVSLGFSGVLEAKPIRTIDFTIHQPYLSTRALGMGNAFAAVADDHSAIFYNPAALAFRKDGNIHMYLNAGADGDYFGLVSDVEDASGGGKTEDEKVEAITELIEKNYGNHYHSRLPALGAVWVRPNWGIAFIPADLSIDMMINKGLGPTVNLNAYLDSTLAYSYARKIGKYMSWGVTAKAIHRIAASDSILAAELATDSEIFNTEDAYEGLTFDVDIGTLYKPLVSERSFLRYMKPTFAVVIRNALDYGFTTNLHLLDDNSGEPPKLERRIDLGSKWDLPKFWVFDPHLAFDVRDILHDNWTFKKGLHLGAELYWKMFNWWKGTWTLGINQGYWTAGFGARLAWFQLDLVTYGEEVGSEDLEQESRRYVVELSVDF